MNRDYKRLACFHAALILDDALRKGCVFGVAKDWADADGAETTVIEGISAGMQELAEELERRGANAPTNAEMVARERGRMKG